MNGAADDTTGKPAETSPLAQNALRADHGDTADALQGDTAPATSERRVPERTASTSSTKVDGLLGTPSRGSTLKRNPSLNPSMRKRASLSRRNSRRSATAGSIKDTDGAGEDDGFNNVFRVPIPTSGNPTEVLANRFQTWRKLLKDLVTYFREIQTSYENRSKSLIKVSNVINNTTGPPTFLTEGGIDDAVKTLRNFHKLSLAEANKAKDIEEDVITQLNGLRNDLNQKIKEIKSLSGDFKNSVDKEKESTRKAVAALQESLNTVEVDPAAISGKSDPYLMRLSVDRQVKKQIEEENYLHRAYLNLEGSGRELESIVVGEIQKAYNAYVGILRRETEHAHETIDELRGGPIAMSKDHEWIHFVETDESFVNPNLPLRKLDEVYYPGKFNPAAAEVRAGMLERKSKYLKSYTPGWYVLSPTHLHEFKSAEHIYTQAPVMSLYLLDQTLGAHSQLGSSSDKFSFKGRQTGAMHRGHSWVFRADSHATMMAWYEDIKALTEKTGEDKAAYVRKHARTTSAGSHKAPSISSDGMGEDEADAQPYSGAVATQDGASIPPKRPEPGGRFPSDVNINPSSQVPLSPSSGDSEFKDDTVMTANSPLIGQVVPPSSEQFEAVDRQDHYRAPIVSAEGLKPAEQQGPSDKGLHHETGPADQKHQSTISRLLPTTLAEATSSIPVAPDSTNEDANGMVAAPPATEPEPGQSELPVASAASEPVGNLNGVAIASVPAPMNSVKGPTSNATSFKPANGVKPLWFVPPMALNDAPQRKPSQPYVPGQFPGSTWG